MSYYLLTFLLLIINTLSTGGKHQVFSSIRIQKDLAESLQAKGAEEEETCLVWPDIKNLLTSKNI